MIRTELPECRNVADLYEPLLAALIRAESAPPAQALEQLLREWQQLTTTPALGVAVWTDGQFTPRVQVGNLPAFVGPLPLHRGQTTTYAPPTGPTLHLAAWQAHPGPGAGFVWAEATATPPGLWTLAAQLLARSPVLTTRIPAVAIDAHRLSQRLADAGTIASRAAHDFDNVLTGILGFADLSLGILPANHPVHPFLVDLIKVGQRGSQLTQQLHQFGRAGQAKPLPAAVGTVLAHEERRLRTQASTNVRIVLNVPDGLPAVAMETETLRSAVQQATNNALEATPAGGTIQLSAQASTLTTHDLDRWFGPVRPGPYVELTVMDTGAGISPETRRRLLVEPFFTTKVRHRGLGVAIAYRAVASHAGGLRIEPAAPSGTRVSLAVPVSTNR